MRVASFRRLSPEIVTSQRLASSYAIVRTSKAEVAIALKKAAPALGISGTAYHIMDILIGLTRSEDWSPENRPIVAISNQKLAEYTSRSVRTVIRCIRRLVESGVLAYKDSSTGRRFIHRDNSGVIERGYGLDFSPARLRVSELTELGEAFAKKLAAEREAKRVCNGRLRALQDLFSLARVHEINLGDIEKTVEKLGEGKQCLLAKAETLDALYDVALNRLSDCLGGRREENESASSCKEQVVGSDDCLSGENFGQQINLAVDDKKLRGKSETIPPLHLLKAGTKQLQFQYGLSFNGWSDIFSGVDKLRLLIGLSEVGWRFACERIGLRYAAVVLAITAEKILRKPSVISSPGGYFLACVDRALRGDLRLAKSLFGLAANEFRTANAEGNAPYGAAAQFQPN